VYTGWRGHFPDVFDPKFANFTNKLAADAAGSEEFTPPLTNSPWLIGTSVDDADDTYGFGPGPNTNQGKVHEHLGWIVAATAPTQQANKSLGLKYSDQTVYSKFAWRDYLKQKYGSIDTLNRAWHSNYTSFDSTGAWGSGSGVLDENGSHKWMGRDFSGLADTDPHVAEDLNGFLEILADKYFSVVSSAVRSYTPHHLVFGPAAINAGARPEILRAAGRHVDALQLWALPDTVDSLVPRAYGLARKPVFLQCMFTSQKDSPEAVTPGWGPFVDFPDQMARGRAYQSFLQKLLALRSDDGTHPVIGIDWWEWVDKVTNSEHMNFGLVSPADNAYDGKEAVRARHKDAWGSESGGERSDYGDFIDAVIHANRDVLQVLALQPSGAVSSVQNAPPAGIRP
jgi:agarase